MRRTASLLTGLHKAQRRAVTHGGGPLLIVAGAGTGKTTVIARRMAWLIEQEHVAPDHVVALTFTEKAAEEMEDRVEKLLPLGHPDLWIHTFHGFGERILKDVALDAGLNPAFTLLTEADQWLFLRKHLFDLKLAYYRPLGNPTRFIRALAKHFSRLKDEDVTPAQYLAYAKQLAQKLRARKDRRGDAYAAAREEGEKTQELAQAYATYQRLLTEAGAMDFGDLITNVLHVFRTRKHLLQRYRQHFPYILVDEFQDTNYAQYQLVKLLAASTNNLTVVGDDDQSIYKFRGAAVSNILGFQRDYPRATSVVLTENYRSTQKILDTAYAAIRHNNPDRLEVKLHIQKRLTSVHGKGVMPVHFQAATQEEEAAMVVKEILDRKGVTDRVRWKDFAILVRANSQADPFLKLLAAKNIPFQFYAARGLYARPEVADLIAYLKLLADPRDSVSAYRVLAAPFFNIPALDLVRLVNVARTKTQSLYDTVADADERRRYSKKTRKELDRFLTLFRANLELARTKSVGQVLYAFVEATGTMQRWLTAGTLEDTTRALNVSQFFKRVLAFEQAAAETSVRDFIEELVLLLEAGEDPAPANPEEGPDAVAVLTVHGAKGLEFPYVFLTNLVHDRFPTRGRREELPVPTALIRENVPSPSQEPHLQEERRLFYVGLTRARERLYLTSAADYGGARQKKSSLFLADIADHLTVRRGTATVLDLPVIVSEAGRVDTTALKLALPKRFSYTQLAAFETCPRQYHYAHVLKIPTLGSHQLSYGRSLHRTLAEFHTTINQGTRIPTLAEFQDMFERNWINEWYDSAEHQRTRKANGWKALARYYRTHRKTFRPVLFIEKGFNLKVGPYVLRGAIDRADELPDGTLEIIDYKTGSVKKQADVDKNVQLALYALAVKQVFHRDVSKLSLYFLDDGKKVTTTRTTEDLATLEKTVRAQIKQILTSDWAPTPSFRCGFCDFKGICDAGQRYLSQHKR